MQGKRASCSQNRVKEEARVGYGSRRPALPPCTEKNSGRESWGFASSQGIEGVEVRFAQSESAAPPHAVCLRSAVFSSWYPATTHRWTSSTGLETLDVHSAGIKTSLTKILLIF